jgi:hypothetical protein
VNEIKLLFISNCVSNKIYLLAQNFENGFFLQRDLKIYTSYAVRPSQQIVISSKEFSEFIDNIEVSNADEYYDVDNNASLPSKRTYIFS